MSKSILDLIIHPVRLQILQLLSVRQMTTQEISAALPDIPTSSLYRHLKQLLDSGMIAVSDTNQVRGIEEKVYALSEAPHIADPETFAGMTPEEHLHYFMMYAASLIQGFAGYVRNTPALDLIADRVGYSEGVFYATPEQVEALGKAINDLLRPLAEQGPGAGRQLRKVGIITHPVFLPDEGKGMEPGPGDDEPV